MKVAGRGSTDNEKEQSRRSDFGVCGNHEHGPVTVALCVVSEGGEQMD